MIFKICRQVLIPQFTKLKTCKNYTHSLSWKLGFNNANLYSSSYLSALNCFFASVLMTPNFSDLLFNLCKNQNKFSNMFVKNPNMNKFYTENLNVCQLFKQENVSMPCPHIFQTEKLWECSYLLVNSFFFINTITLGKKQLSNPKTIP